MKDRGISAGLVDKISGATKADLSRGYSRCGMPHDVPAKGSPARDVYVFDGRTGAVSTEDRYRGGFLPAPSGEAEDHNTRIRTGKGPA